MGEKSRFIGEVGEDVVEKVLRLIGWSTIPNIEIACTERLHNQRTHDIDRFTSYRCPLENDVAIDVAVSVKYNDITSGYKTEFIKYGESLIKALSCFKRDTIYNLAIKGIFSKTRKSHHVLFWLNHSQDLNKDLVTEIGDIIETASFNKEEVILMDNYRTSFLIKSIEFANNLFRGSKVTFVYPRTGFNEKIGGRQLDGKLLPLNMLNSPILPFKIIDDNNKKILLVTVNEAFEEENLKRVIGLVQNLTEGWCNKIVIAYPDFQHSKHNLIKQTVLLMFNESGFSDMIDVVTYNTSFKSYENSLLPMVEVGDTKVEFNIETLLPFGDQLRQLLNQSYIYKGDLLLLLRRRGVFVGRESSKESLGPKLCKTLISPNEFEFLKRKQISKEASEKRTDEKISVSNLEKAEEALKSFEVSIEEIISKKHYDCELIDFSREYDYSGNFRINYKIKRKELTKDWATTQSEHQGEILVVKQQYESNEQGFRIDKMATSQETKDINRQIAFDIISHLKETGAVRKTELSKRITSDEFDSIQLASFIFSFMEIDSARKLKFKSTMNIDLKPNPNVNLPEDIDSLKDKVEHSFFEGNNLQEIKYVSDPKYREMFIFANLTSIFHFKFIDIEGDAKIEYGFPDLLKDLSKKDDFEYKVLEVNPWIDKNLSSKETHELKERVVKEFSIILNDNYASYQRKYGVQLEMKL